MLASLCNIRLGNYLFSYLRVPLFKGKPKRLHLQEIADSILAKFERWKGKRTSFYGWQGLHG